MTSQRCTGGDVDRNDSTEPRLAGRHRTGVRGRDFRVPSRSRCPWNGPCTHRFPSSAGNTSRQQRRSNKPVRVCTEQNIRSG